MKIAIGCDPNAQQAKEELIKFMEDKGYGEIKDFGSEDPIYANTAVAVAEAVASGAYDRGILICGTGLGVSIAANKVKGAYAALLSDIYSAKRARLSNDANIACMGAFTIGNKLREELTDAFLTNEFVPGCSSQPKVDAFRDYEAAHQKEMTKGRYYHFFISPIIIIRKARIFHPGFSHVLLHVLFHNYISHMFF